MNKEKAIRVRRICENRIFPLLLLLYPLRHIHWGLDLWDTGYNYANFRYMGLEHMDPMWLFSTYLANGVGHILTLLPFGHTLLGMNLYTGLFVSLTAVLAYFFCVRYCGMPAVAVFWGEFLAVSLCWCPTALLYNYLTYLLLLVCVILLCKGLTEEKMGYLALAGAALGANVFVRFSNLPEAGLIVGVWAYGVICRKKLPRVLKETGYCVLGYAAALAAGLGYLALRYGPAAYGEGIGRLFSMTDHATGYKPTSMLYSMYLGYRKNLHWFILLAGFLLAGFLLCFLLPAKYKKSRAAVCGCLAAGNIALFYRLGFCSQNFDEYEAIRLPGILFLMLALLLCGIRVLQRSVPKREKLLAGMILLVLLITPIGSNNGLLPAINNLFLALPYMLCCFRQLWEKKDGGKRFSLLPLKAVWGGFLLLFAFQSAGFGLNFVFVEAHGAKEVDTKTENNDILKGIFMSGERAGWMDGISAYARQEGLEGKEVILYGNIPSLSFYLNMPSAFNPWSDLASYDEGVMEAALEETAADALASGEFPVIILEKKYALYRDGGAEALTEAGYTASEAEAMTWDTKQELLWNYMDQWGYEESYSNQKFVLYRTEKRDHGED